MSATKMPTTRSGREMLRVLDAARDIPANHGAAFAWERMDPDMQVIGGLSWPSKMPGAAFGLPPEACNVGARMAAIPGTVCSACYAMRGQYSFGDATAAQQRRLLLLYGTDATTWVNAFVRVLEKARVDFFRWHDSGDIQGVWHLQRIVDVCRATPHIRHWLPTREIAVVREYQAQARAQQAAGLDAGIFPPNLVVRISGNKPDQPAPQVEGCTTAAVYTAGKIPVQGEACHAYDVNGKMRPEGCGDCRLCWSDKAVAYPFH